MQYDFSLAPGAAQRFEVDGKFFKNTGSTGKIRVTTSKGEYVDLVAGQGVYGVEFSSLSVKDISGSANVGSIIIGNFDFRDDTINGTIALIPDVFVRTRNIDTRNALAGNCFGASFGTQQISAAQINAGLLYNPAASGKNVIITQIKYDGAAPGITVRMGTYIPVGVTKAANKLAGGASSSSVCVVEDVPVGTAIVASAPSLIYGPSSATGTTTSGIYQFKEPIILPPGKTMSIARYYAATDGLVSTVFVEFSEEPV